MSDRVVEERVDVQSWHKSSRRFVVLVGSLGIVATVWLALCVEGTLARGPEVTPAEPTRVPVVFVPGITGVELRDAESGKILWGKGLNLMFPRDRGYNTARPLAEGSSRSMVEAGDVILKLRLAGVVRKAVYQPIVNLLEAEGYRLGSLDDPRPEDSLFLFGYDWRQSNVESARQLLERLEQARLARGEPRFSVALVCQSNGATLCRYLARYGAATIEEAEAGKVELPSTLEIQKVILLGASNGGSIRILRELNRGRRYVPWVGRKLGPESFFAYESLYQDLPAYTDDLFLDGKGQSVAVDLYDVASWRKYQWSVFDPEVESRLAKAGRFEVFGDRAAREAFLARALGQAKRVQRLLRSESGGPAAGRYYWIHNDHNETIARALLVEEKGGWKTYFLGDKALARYPTLVSRLGAAGDGHSTLQSQQWLSASERRLLSPEVMNVEGKHFEMIHNPRAQQFLLESLAAPIPEENPQPSAE